MNEAPLKICEVNEVMTANAKQIDPRRKSLEGRFCARRPVPSVMRFLVIPLLCAGLEFAPAQQTFAAEAATGRLVVEVSGIKDDVGVVKIGLYDKAGSFLDSERAVRGIDVPAAKGQIAGAFDSLPAGRYAIAVIHDENRNGTLDKNFLGIPREGYAFSQNARGSFGPPEFAEASFRFDGGIQAIHIDMRY